MFVVVCYDIADDRRRNRIAALLEENGSRVQESVFECLLSDVEIRDVETRAAAILAPEDKIRYYGICPKCLGRARQGGGPPFHTEPLAYVV
jgi:CRISPR-associated protein Cas2